MNLSTAIIGTGIALAFFAVNNAGAAAQQQYVLDIKKDFTGFAGDLALSNAQTEYATANNKIAALKENVNRVCLQ